MRLTHFREMTGPIATFLRGIFGRPGAVLRGQVPVSRRNPIVDAPQSDDGPPFLLVLSFKIGGSWG